MAYTDQDFKSKAAVKRALAAGETITVHQPGGFFGTAETVPQNGKVSLEGPHYPQPHTWWGTGTMKDGVLVSIT